MHRKHDRHCASAKHSKVKQPHVNTCICFSHHREIIADLLLQLYNDGIYMLKNKGQRHTTTSDTPLMYQHYQTSHSDGREPHAQYPIRSSYICFKSYIPQHTPPLSEHDHGHSPQLLLSTRPQVQTHLQLTPLSIIQQPQHPKHTEVLPKGSPPD